MLHVISFNKALYLDSQSRWLYLAFISARNRLIFTDLSFPSPTIICVIASRTTSKGRPGLASCDMHGTQNPTETAISWRSKGLGHSPWQAPHNHLLAKLNAPTQFLARQTDAQGWSMEEAGGPSEEGTFPMVALTSDTKRKLGGVSSNTPSHGVSCANCKVTGPCGRTFVQPEPGHGGNPDIGTQHRGCCAQHLSGCLASPALWCLRSQPMNSPACWLGIHCDVHMGLREKAWLLPFASDASSLPIFPQWPHSSGWRSEQLCKSRSPSLNGWLCLNDSHLEEEGEERTHTYCK